MPDYTGAQFYRPLEESTCSTWGQSEASKLHVCAHPGALPLKHPGFLERGFVGPQVGEASSDAVVDTGPLLRVAWRTNAAVRANRSGRGPPDAPVAKYGSR
jgi:hypothetical protein